MNLGCNEERNMSMTEKEKMISGKNYNTLDLELCQLRTNARILTQQYNATTPDDGEKRIKLLDKLLGSCTNNTFIEPNFNCILLDVCKITIGDNVFIGPDTCITTANHPILHKERLMTSLGSPITIGNNVWIGANCTILPGITIDDSSVIGAGSVVTKNIPENVIAVGNPCKILRPITDKDSFLTNLNN